MAPEIGTFSSVTIMVGTSACMFEYNLRSESHRKPSGPKRFPKIAQRGMIILSTASTGRALGRNGIGKVGDE